MIWILLIFAFIPTLIYVAWIRNTEKYEREPWSALIFVFIWGATLSIISAIILEKLFEIPLIDFVNNGDIVTIMLGVIIAPAVEEFTKPLSMTTRIIRKNINEIEDGLIYGAVAGLGFSATENLLYGMYFSKEGIVVIIALFITRTIGSCLLHASATALTGYGYSRYLIEKRPFASILPFFLFAIMAHSIYNLFAFSSIYTDQIFGVIAAILFAIVAITWIRKKIKKLDQEHPTDD